MEGRFLQSVALLMAVHNPCQRREMTVSTNNGLVNGLVHNLLQAVFTCFSPYLGSRPGGGGLPRDGYTTCLFSFSPRTAQKSKFLKLVLLIP